MGFLGKLKQISEEQLKNYPPECYEGTEIAVVFKDGETSYTPFLMFSADFSKKTVVCMRKNKIQIVSFSDIRDIGII